MEIYANIKYLRISPKKIRELAGLLRGIHPQEAMDRLTIKGNKAARLLVKAINSAQANAVKNSKLAVDKLRIKKIEIQKGPQFKRWQAISRGQAHSIKKKTTHIKVVLEDINTQGKNESKKVTGISKPLGKTKEIIKKIAKAK